MNNNKCSLKTALVDASIVGASCAFGVAAGVLAWKGLRGCFGPNLEAASNSHIDESQHDTIGNELKDEKDLAVARNKAIICHFRYLNEFVQLKCSVDLLKLKIFPDAKEVTESFSVYNAIRKHLDSNAFDSNLTDVTAVVVGDGATPRIGAVLCYRTKWNQIVSCDPIMKLKKEFDTIRNLSLYQAKIENISIQCQNKNIVVIFMHSHVDIELSLNSLCFDESQAQISIITCPCCNWVETQKRLYDTKPDLTYQDVSLCSEMNTFHIWKDCSKLIVDFRNKRLKN